jgi:hypothetical protein
MHAIVFSFLDLFRSFVSGECGRPEVDAIRRVEEQRDNIDARSYLSHYAGTRRS